MKRKVFNVHNSAKKSWALALGIVLLLAFCSSAGSQPARLNHILSLRSKVIIATSPMPLASGNSRCRRVARGAL